MKKLLTALVIMILCAGLLCGCFAAAGWRDEGYRKGSGTVSEPIENLEIDWTSGEIRIAYHSGNTVLLEEECRGSLPEDQKMRWKVENKTLKVYYSKPVLFSFGSKAKKLTVTLPEGIALKQVSLQGTSADLFVPALKADEIRLGSTSGDVQATVAAPTVSVDSTSGDITLRLTEKAGQVRMTGTSGIMNLTADQADQVTISTTSGGIGLDIGQVKKAKIDSTSGVVVVKVAQFGELGIHVTSGNVEAALSAVPGFTGKFSVTSGRVDTQMPLAKSGDTYTCGDGSGKLTISTTSGNILVKEIP